MKTILYAISLCLLLTSACTKTTTNTDSVEMAEDENEETFDDNEKDVDADFATEAANGGMLEVKLGELAVKNASNDRIKQFAQKMIDDHGRANDQLKALADQKGISLPTVLGEDNQKTFDDLSTKTGADFDKAYADLMVKDHKDDVDAFRKESENGNDPDLKKWAGETLPVLEHHLQMAEENKAAIK